MKRIAAVLAIGLGPMAAAQSVVYTHTLNPVGSIQKSAWYFPDGLNSDAHTWDSFTLSTPRTITQIQWLGGYTNFLSGAGTAPVYAFEVSIWPSTASNTQPDILGGPIVEWLIQNNAGETPTGQTVQTSWPHPVGLSPIYAYSFPLPSPFAAAANTTYWLQIVARQGLTPLYFWPPDWGHAGATGGNIQHFRALGGTGHTYQFVTHDLTFTLLGPAAPCYPNCDNSTTPPILNVDDFTCFINQFALGRELSHAQQLSHYANCDHSTTAPVLNVDDFTCFINQFAAGCP